MTTATRMRAPRARYTTPSRHLKSAAHPQDEPSEQGWFIFLMAIVLALGIVFIGGISYVVILG